MKRKQVTRVSWTDAKNKRNQQDHQGLSFQKGRQLFDNGTLQTNPLAFWIEKKGKEQGEVRCYGIGEIKEKIYVIIYSPKYAKKPIRIISFRIADREEVKAYRTGQVAALVQAYQRRQNSRLK